MLKQCRFHRVVHISLHCKLQLASQDWRRNRVPALEDLSTLGPEKTNFRSSKKIQPVQMATFHPKFLPPVYVVRLGGREGYIFTGVCLSTAKGLPTSPVTGYPPYPKDRAWVVASQDRTGGTHPGQDRTGGYPPPPTIGNNIGDTSLAVSWRTFLLPIISELPNVLTWP